MKSLLIIIFTLSSFIAMSCDCDSNVGFSEADYVFIGRVMDVQRKGQFGEVKVTIRIYCVLKGTIKSKQVNVYCPCISDECCGIHFVRGKQFKVYARLVGGNMFTNYCTSTQEIPLKAKD